MASSSDRPARASRDLADTVAAGDTPPELPAVGAGGHPAPASKAAKGSQPPGKSLSGSQSADTGQPDPSSRTTSRLGDFEVRKKLGQGGMGVVYLAHQISLDRPVALKVLAKELAAKKGFVERFVREARAMAKINHPHVVNCFHVGEEKGLHFVAMELMDGQSMQDWLNQLKRIPVADAVLVAIVCGDAMQHAHSLHMVHRDIKPDNILVTKKGVVKVSDLGLAKALDDEDMSMTQSGTGLGTPHYMPPEQARNAKHVDPTCDVYALGSTLYHFVTGQTPFAGESIVELILNKEKGNYRPARHLNKEVPDRLSLIIDKAMAKDRKGRYQSCADFVRDLEALEIAGDSLSFITGERAILRRSSSGGMAATRAARLPPAPAASGKAAPAPAQGKPAAETGQGEWFVRHADSDGKTKVSKLSTAQVLQLMRSDRFDMKTQAAVSAKAPFLPLAQIPAFKDESQKLVTRQKMKARDHSLAAEFAKIDKQVQRQKWWRLLSRFRDGTLGLVGLVLWLSLIAAAIVGGIVAYPYALEYVRGMLNRN
ncbi:MAG: serine/threonine protein kinase [Planctomyces sp.]|nr:serine/threonine protein kinase [Planctomyces sp.]